MRALLFAYVGLIEDTWLLEKHNTSPVGQQSENICNGYNMGKRDFPGIAICPSLRTARKCMGIYISCGT